MCRLLPPGGGVPGKVPLGLLGMLLFPSFLSVFTFAQVEMGSRQREKALPGQFAVCCRASLSASLGAVKQKRWPTGVPKGLSALAALPS